MTAGASSWTVPTAGSSSSTSTTHPSKTSPTRSLSSAASTMSTHSRSTVSARRVPSAISFGQGVQRRRAPTRAARCPATAARHSSRRVPVDEAAQRGRAVGVGRRRPRRGRRVWAGAPSREDACSPRRAAGSCTPGGRRRGARCAGRGSGRVGVRDVVRPVDVQGLGRAAQPGHRAVRGGGQGAQDAGAAPRSSGRPRPCR